MSNEKPRIPNYSCPPATYWDDEDPMRVEKEIFRKAFNLAHDWYLIGVAPESWGALVTEFHRKLFDPYKNSDEPMKKLAHGLATAVCEYLQARAYDSKIPSRAALMKKQTEELKGQLENMKPNKEEKS